MRLRLRLRHPSPAETLTIKPTLRLATRPLRVLDFDIENRPLSYLGSDFTTAEVTAIAWAWTDHPNDVECYLLGETSLPFILHRFVEVYNQADMVTGHYILGHDLPMVNGALVEFGFAPLTDKMVRDTKIHFVRTKGISLSQESLGAMARLEHGKVQMNQAKWRSANRLEPQGLVEVKQRVTGDVTQHIEMCNWALDHGYLAPPTLWKSGAAKTQPYTP